MASILSILLSLPVRRKDNLMEGIICGGQILVKIIAECIQEQI